MLLFSYYNTYRGEGPTRAELLSLLGDIQSKLAYTNEKISIYRTDNKRYDGLQKLLFYKRTNASMILEGAVSDFIQSELECSAQNRGAYTAPNNSCEAMLNNLVKVQQAKNNMAKAVANVGDYNWADKQKYIKLLYQRKNDLENQKKMVKVKLGEYDPLVGNIRDRDPQFINNVIESNKEDSWTQFEYNSDEMESSKDSDYSKTVSSWTTKRVSTNIFTSSTRTTTTTITKGRTRLEEEMAEASLKVKGKLLRVHIKRPWFKPEIFDDRNLDFVS